MNIFTPTMLCHWLGDAVINVRSGIMLPRCDGGIKLIDSGQSVLSADCMHIGTAQSIEDAVVNGRIPSKSILILSSGNCNIEKVPDSLTLIETNLSAIDLYNSVQEHIHRFNLWDTSLQNAVYSNAGLQELLQRASAEISANILLLNVGYKSLAAVYSPDIQDDISYELQNNGYLSFETIQAAQHAPAIRQERRENCIEYISPGSQNYTIVRLIRHQDNLVGRLCVILNGSEPNSYYSELSGIVAKYVAEYMLSNQGVDYSSNAAFGTLAADLIECRLTDPVELEQRLKQIQLAVRRYYHIILVAFGSKEDRSTIPWGYIISQLEQIFPYSNITTYRGEILMLVRKTKRGHRLDFDREKMLQILDHYDGYAAIGNTSEFLTSMPPVYYQTRDALRLGRKMSPEQRIFYYEDYSMYQIVELASDSARQRLGSRNLAHLCNNETIALLLYDNKHGSNLLDFLHTYLINERNVTETAKELYIHRNTAQYKIHKIEEIIGSPLDDPILRERLLFSYHVLEYMKRYRKEDILVLKRNQTDDVPRSTE